MENLKEINITESKEQFLQEIQEIMEENPKLYEAFAKEKYE